MILGNEAAGVVASVGPGVTDVKPGDRVGYAGMSAEFFEQTGAYAEERNVPVERLLKLPAGVTEQQAAGMMVKGLTASLIINHVYRPKPGDTILIHAAASGVGLILTQWAKHLGATVIGTVGSAEKAEIAQAHGCDHTILYRETDFADAVKQIVPQGVSAVFDGVGKDTFMASLRCVRPFGMLVNYGNASGHPPPLDLLLLAKGGSLSVCRPALSSAHRQRRAHAQGRGRTVRSGRARRSQGRDQPDLPVARRRRGAPRHRAAAIRRLDGADAVITARGRAVMSPPVF